MAETIQPRKEFLALLSKSDEFDFQELTADSKPISPGKSSETRSFLVSIPRSQEPAVDTPGEETKRNYLLRNAKLLILNASFNQKHQNTANGDDKA